MFTLAHALPCGSRRSGGCLTAATYLARWRTDGQDRSRPLCDDCAETVRRGLAEHADLDSWSIAPLPDLPAMTVEQERQRVAFADGLVRIAEVEEERVRAMFPADLGPARLSPAAEHAILTSLQLRRIAFDIANGLEAGWLE